MPVRRRVNKSKGRFRITSIAIDAFRILRKAEEWGDDWWNAQIRIGDELGIGPDQSFPQVYDERIEPVGWEWPAIAYDARDALEAASRK